MLSNGKTGWRRRHARHSFRDAIRNSADVVARWDFHDTGPIFARTCDGTLQLSDQWDGLWFTATLPDTKEGWAILKWMRRGWVGASTSFTAGNRQRLRDRRGRLIIEETKIESLEDITITRSPRFPQTFCRVKHTRK